MARDYMKALYDRFETPSKRASILRRAVKTARKQLAPQLTKQQKKILLRMGDLEDALRYPQRVGGDTSLQLRG